MPMPMKRTIPVYLRLLFVTIVSAVLFSACGKASKMAETDAAETPQPPADQTAFARVIPNTRLVLYADTLHENDKIMLHNLWIKSPDDRVLWRDSDYYYVADEDRYLIEEYVPELPGFCRTIQLSGSKQVDYILLRLLPSFNDWRDHLLLHYKDFNITETLWVSADAFIQSDGVLNIIGRDGIEAYCSRDCDSGYYNPFEVYTLGHDKPVRNAELEKDLTELIYATYLGNTQQYVPLEIYDAEDIDILTHWWISKDFKAILYRNSDFARQIEDRGRYLGKVDLPECTAYRFNGMASFDNPSPFILLYDKNAVLPDDGPVDYLWLGAYYGEDMFAEPDSFVTFWQQYDFDTETGDLYIDVRQQIGIAANTGVTKPQDDSAHIIHRYHADGKGFHYLQSDTLVRFRDARHYNTICCTFNPAEPHMPKDMEESNQHKE